MPPKYAHILGGSLLCLKHQKMVGDDTSPREGPHLTVLIFKNIPHRRGRKPGARSAASNDKVPDVRLNLSTRSIEVSNILDCQMSAHLVTSPCTRKQSSTLESNDRGEYQITMGCEETLFPEFGHDIQAAIPCRRYVRGLSRKKISLNNSMNGNDGPSCVLSSLQFIFIV